jgi:pyruvate formate-lyase/glycerol dehydratase family glycyl radical enzyme
MPKHVEARRTENIGRWDELFVRTCSKRIQKAIKRALGKPEICLERARAEIKSNEMYQNESRVIQRARVFETYLRDKTIFILDDELLVGNVDSKVRGSPIFAEFAANWLDKELDDPAKDFALRAQDRHIIHDSERKELRESIIPYWKGRTFEDYVLRKVDDELKEKAFAMYTSCPHMPNMGDLMLQKDIGHQMANYEKVLHKGLNGIKEEVKWYLAQLDYQYMHYGVQQTRDFYNAVIIALDAAIAYAKRYADLADEMSAKEVDPRRRRELKQIAETCRRVPANPARDWREALQSVWFIQCLIHCELLNLANSFGRFDQYMYPFYKKTVIDERSMSRDEALELLEAFWVKVSEFTIIWSWDIAKVQAGFPMSQNLLIGGQTRDGKDACNEVTMLCMEAEEQVGLIQPEIAMRVWEGTPYNYLKKAAEIVRLGRGKLKFYSERRVQQLIAKTYPDLTIEDWRDAAMMGCIEPNLPHITQQNSFCGITLAAKLLELVLNNGKCPLCGKQIGPLTGDPRSFESIAAVKQAFREQVFYWTKIMCRGIRIQFEAEAERNMAPFCSSLLEGPLRKGIDVAQGGAWYNTYGLFYGGLADTADSLAVIDKLIYRDKKITWDQLLEALKANWQGHENLRQLCINGVPKYGNDDDYPDHWAAFVMDTYADFIDWANTQRDLFPSYGGVYQGGIIVNNTHAAFGLMVGALPNGHIAPNPLGDTCSPVQGMDRNGPTAVIKSVSKLPMHRFTMGAPLNQKLSPQLVASDRDIDNFVAYIRSCAEMGIHHIQFNVISADLLRKAMKEPENYRNLMVRVGSYCSYFVELDPVTQLEIISRTEQNRW